MAIPYRVNYDDRFAYFQVPHDAHVWAQRWSEENKSRTEVFFEEGIIGQYRDGVPTPEFQGRGDEVYPKGYVVPDPDRFPGMPEEAWSQARRARALGLTVLYFNSGVRNNPSNGYRVFRSRRGVDYFDEGYLTCAPDARQVRAFLDGFEEARRAP